MAIKKEFYFKRSDGVDLYRTYSDSGFLIKKVGKKEYYEEAIDVDGAGFKYEETEHKIGVNEND